MFTDKSEKIEVHGIGDDHPKVVLLDEEFDMYTHDGSDESFGAIMDGIHGMEFFVNGVPVVILRGGSSDEEVAERTKHWPT